MSIIYFYLGFSCCPYMYFFPHAGSHACFPVSVQNHLIYHNDLMDAPSNKCLPYAFKFVLDTLL